MGKYKRQVGRLLTSMPRQRGSAGAGKQNRFSYNGANPATTKSDILDLFDYAHEHNLSINIEYSTQKGKSKNYTLEPKNISNEKIYAFVAERKSHSNFQVNRLKISSFH